MLLHGTALKYHQAGCSDWTVPCLHLPNSLGEQPKAPGSLEKIILIAIKRKIKVGNCFKGCRKQNLWQKLLLFPKCLYSFCAMDYGVWRSAFLCNVWLLFFWIRANIANKMAYIPVWSISLKSISGGIVMCVEHSSKQQNTCSFHKGFFL